ACLSALNTPLARYTRYRAACSLRACAGQIRLRDARSRFLRFQRQKSFETKAPLSRNQWNGLHQQRSSPPIPPREPEGRVERPPRLAVHTRSTEAAQLSPRIACPWQFG